MATDKTRYKDVKVRIPEEELAVLNCRVALLVVLMLVSGSAAIGTAVVASKRKNNR